ncbi:4701_t:CDS:2, partial [Cetraspora pellucida]
MPKIEILADDRYKWKKKGTAYTLIIQKEDKFVGDLVKNLEASGQQ